MSDKIKMVALVPHQTGTPQGMVNVGDEFEVSEPIAKSYESREERPLAKRADGSDPKREKTTDATGTRSTASKSPAKRPAKTAPRKAATKTTETVRTAAGAGDGAKTES